MVTEDPSFRERIAEGLAQIADAYDAHRKLRAAGDVAAPEPAGLYLSADDLTAGLQA